MTRQGRISTSDIFLLSRTSVIDDTYAFPYIAYPGCVCPAKSMPVPMSQEGIVSVVCSGSKMPVKSKFEVGVADDETWTKVWLTKLLALAHFTHKP